MRLAAPFLASLMLASPLLAADTHPFSVHDMLAMDRISDPRVSPDGQRVVFTVRTTDMQANRGRNDLWLAAVDGSWTRRLTSHEASDSQGRWSSDGKTIYFVSARTGSSRRQPRATTCRSSRSARVIPRRPLCRWVWGLGPMAS